MAQERKDRPYLRHNFKVQIDGQVSGFQEVSGLGVEISVAEYRNGDYAFNHPIKIMGLTKVPDVTLKRGVIGELSLHEWIKATQGGKDDPRSVVIELLAETGGDDVVQTWTLSNARPLKYTGPPLSGTAGAEVAVEELVLSCEGIDQE